MWCLRPRFHAMSARSVAGCHELARTRYFHASTRNLLVDNQQEWSHINPDDHGNDERWTSVYTNLNVTPGGMIPGFPIESILAGIVVGACTLVILRAEAYAMTEQLGL